MSNESKAVIESIIKSINSEELGRDTVASIRLCPSLMRFMLDIIELQACIDMSRSSYLLGINVIEDVNLPKGKIVMLNKFNEILEIIEVEGLK